MAYKKISELAEALGIDITPGTDVIIINDGSVTKKIKVDEFLAAAGTAISGNLVPVPNDGDTTSSFSLGSPDAAWKDIYVSDGTLFMQQGDGTRTEFRKTDLDDLKAGKSLNASQIEIGGLSFTKAEIEKLKSGSVITTTSNRLVKRKAVPTKSSRPSKGTAASQTMDEVQKVDALVNNVDDTTFIQSNVAGEFDFVVNNTSSFAITTSSVDISVPVFLPSITGSTSFTGSTEFSGSTTVSGSFTVTDLLTVLADYGQTGSFSVSGSTSLAGDINMDGAVTVTDLLTVIAGFGASGSNSVTGSLEVSGSGLVVNGGSKALIITGSTEVSGSTIFSGSFDQSGSFNSEGDSTFTGSFEQSGSTTFTGGGFNVNNLLDLLANFGQTGIPTGSGQGGVAEGDINLDGQVNVTDMLLLLAGYGNPNIIVNNLTIPANTNYQMVGPEISISQSIVVSVGNNSFFSIT